MVILLNEHSIFWSFLYARLVWCVPDAGSHQNIANFRLGKKSIERLIIYLKNKRKNRILRCTGIPKKKNINIFESSIVLFLDSKKEVLTIIIASKLSTNKSKLVYIDWRGKKTE